MNIIPGEGGCDRSRGDALRVTFDQLDYAGRHSRFLAAITDPVYGLPLRVTRCNLHV